MQLRSQQDLDHSMERLLSLDDRLRNVLDACLPGPIALRQREKGLAGLLAIVLAQQVSVASARAIWSRFSEAFPDCDVDAIADTSNEDLRALSLSRPKVRTVRAICTALQEGFDLAALVEIPGEEAHAQLCSLHGVGPWTADIYLLFCLGHQDIFPAGDLALQVAVGKGLGLADKPDAKSVARIACDHWAPERSAAAHLFWAYYHALKAGRDGVL